MRLPEKPCLASPRLPCVDGADDALRMPEGDREGGNCDLTFASFEKNAQVAAALLRDDDALAELRMRDAESRSHASGRSQTGTRHAEIF